MSFFYGLTAGPTNKTERNDQSIQISNLFISATKRGSSKIVGYLKKVIFNGYFQGFFLRYTRIALSAGNIPKTAAHKSMPPNT